jgi:drug/metabolite transporter (DMT)-like permease
MEPTPAFARLQLLLVAVLFSTGGAVAKATALGGWQVASLRSLVAAITLLLFMRGGRRSWSGRSMLVGVAYAGSMIGFILSSKLTTGANAVLLAGTAPLYVALLAPWLLREPLRRAELLYMAVMALGMVLCLTDAEPRYATAPDPVAGNLIAVVTGVFWALTVLGLRWLGRDDGDPKDGATAVVSGNVIAFLVCLPMVFPLPALRPFDFGIVVFLGSIQIGLAYILLTVALRRVPALEASLVLLVEPVLGSLLNWAVHGEVPGAWALVGGALILGSTVLKTGIELVSSRLRAA